MFLTMGWLAVATAACCAGADPVPLHGETVVRFASVEQGRAVLGRRDRFIQALSPFDRQRRLQASGQVTEPQLLEFVTAQVVAWEPDQRAKLTACLRSVRDKLVPFRLPLPPTVLLIQTTGREEANAPHCRGQAIVLPRRVLQQPDEQLERLLLHELFHILSASKPKLRCELYRIVGFHCSREIELPATLRDRKITNPDAPLIDCYIELHRDGRTVHAAPVLLASAEKYDPQQARSFFDYLQFRLMLVRQQQGRWQPALSDGQPVLLDPKSPDQRQVADSFFRQIGRNTGYIIHPEEILADNFVHLVLGTERLETPRIVQALRQRLAAP